MSRAVAASLASVVLAGCGSVEEPVEREVAAYRPTTARFAATMTSVLDGERHETRSVGLMDFARGISRTESTGDGVTTTTITIGGSTFTAFEPSALPNGRRWLRLDSPREHVGRDAGETGTTPTEPASSDGGASGVVLSFPGSFDPSAVVAEFEADGAIFAEVGNDVLDGVLTTHLRATYAPPSFELWLEGGGSVDEQEDEGDPATQIDVWLDEGRLARKVVSQTRLGGELEWMYEVRFFAFGRPVHVAAPPADQVVEWDELPTGEVATSILELDDAEELQARKD